MASSTTSIDDIINLASGLTTAENSNMPSASHRAEQLALLKTKVDDHMSHLEEAGKILEITQILAFVKLRTHLLKKSGDTPEEYAAFCKELDMLVNDLAKKLAVGDCSRK